MIPEKFTYVFVNFFTILFPFIFSFTKAFDFKKYWTPFIVVNVCVTMLYIAWDIAYTHLGVWGFNHRYTLGIQFFKLPLEELFFFICIPFSCLFTYYCFRKFVFKKLTWRGQFFWLLFAILFLIMALFNHEKLYTAAAFLSCFISFLLAFKSNSIAFFHFLAFYLVILIPFFIFNGILTGSYLGRIVVFYNDHENLGIRLTTIPLEDVFYGMAMLHFNILGFEYLAFQKKFAL